VNDPDNPFQTATPFINSGPSSDAANLSIAEVIKMANTASQLPAYIRNLEQRTQSAEESMRYKEARIKELMAEVDKLQKKLAEVKKRNVELEEMADALI